MPGPTYRYRGCNLKIVPDNNAQLTQLLRIQRRGVSVGHDVPMQASKLCGMNLFRDYPLMIPILLPNERKVWLGRCCSPRHRMPDVCLLTFIEPQGVHVVSTLPYQADRT
jgi:hypothetical protein